MICPNRETKPTFAVDFTVNPQVSLHQLTRSCRPMRCHVYQSTPGIFPSPAEPHCQKQRGRSRISRSKIVPLGLYNDGWFDVRNAPPRQQMLCVARHTRAVIRWHNTDLQGRCEGYAVAASSEHRRHAQRKRRRRVRQGPPGEFRSLSEARSVVAVVV